MLFHGFQVFCDEAPSACSRNRQFFALCIKITNINRKQSFQQRFVILQNRFERCRFGSLPRWTQRTQCSSSKVKTESHSFEQIPSFSRKLNKVGKLLNGIQCVSHHQYFLWTVLHSQVQRMTKTALGYSDVIVLERQTSDLLCWRLHRILAL